MTHTVTQTVTVIQTHLELDAHMSKDHPDGAPLAPGSRATKEALSDPARRPPRAREDLSEALLDQETFLKCLRTAK